MRDDCRAAFRRWFVRIPRDNLLLLQQGLLAKVSARSGAFPSNANASINPASTDRASCQEFWKCTGSGTFYLPDASGSPPNHPGFLPQVWNGPRTVAGKLADIED